MKQKLSRLLEEIKVLEVIGNIDKNVVSLKSDSRKAAKDGIFVAVKGVTTDGHKYIPVVVSNHVGAVVCEEMPSSLEKGVTYIRVSDSAEALGLLASAWYDHPSKKLKLVGVTGTNGKTTTATLLYEMAKLEGYKAGLLSTVCNYIHDRAIPTTHTTPDPLTLNSLLNDMVLAGCDYAFMEVSSHSTEQKRVAGLHFAGGVFSNLTRDHLDYHKTFDHYRDTKKQLFDQLDKKAFAITNCDDKNGLVMTQNTHAKVYTYSTRSMADFRGKILEESFEGMLLKIDGRECWSSLIGQHNAYNLLALYTTAVSLGADPEETLMAMSALRPAPGRLENIRGPKDISVIIDYAHTPDALENVLKTLREIAPDHELICLFGCGGDRDRTKRPEMARIAEKMADRIIVTSDNSRTEKTTDIMADIKAGLELSGRAKSLFIEDREQAIRTAIMIAGQGATILLAGKGHETYQIIGKEKHHFDEKEIVNGIFAEMSI